jgi:sulfatase modifying factor 1
VGIAALAVVIFTLAILLLGKTLMRMIATYSAYSILGVVAMALFASSTQAVPVPTQGVEIEWVTIGNPGNVPDTRYNSISVGSVPYEYRIGKYEVTAGQYTEFLNAVAADDPNGLYNTSMWSNGSGAQIERNGMPGSYSYTVAADYANRPVNYVGVWEAARFANWLHNGQPAGLQGPGTTEDGAYLNIGSPLTFTRQPGAKYFLPTEDEWYKAAYYDPHRGGMGVGGYWDFPTGTSDLPGTDLTESTNPSNNMNYWFSSLVIGPPYYRTEVGEFELSDSPYGTFDQGGNLHEWNETSIDGGFRGVRGGSWRKDVDSPLASARDRFNPAVNTDYVGFRLASLAIPEPGTISILAIGCLSLSLRRM